MNIYYNIILIFFTILLIFEINPHFLALYYTDQNAPTLLNPICPGPLGPDRFPGGGSKCPDSIQPTILMIFQILFLQGLRYVYKGLETKIWGP